MTNKSINVGDHGETGGSPPTGILARLVSLSDAGKEHCQDLSFFFGSNPEIEAQVFMHSHLEAGAVEDLATGTYRIRLHPAWKGNELNANDWDISTVLGELVFVVEKSVRLFGELSPMEKLKQDYAQLADAYAQLLQEKGGEK